MPASKDIRAATLLESGLRNFQEGQVEQARQCCERALKLAPRNPDALHLLGLIALQHAEPARALELLRQAAAMRPEVPAYQCNLGYAYAGLGRLPEALAAFERAAALDAADPELPVNVGVTLAKMGRPAEAEAAFRQVIERAPQYWAAWFNLGKALEEQERYQEACSAYEQALRLAPQHADAHHNLALTLQRLGRFEDAERAYRACLRLRPDDATAMVNLAITLNCLRQHAEAERLCRAALARDPRHVQAWPILGASLSFQHRWQDAVHCYKHAADSFPQSSIAAGDYANALACIGRFPEAMAQFDRALALENVSMHTRSARAVAFFSAGRLVEGAAAYQARHERSAFVENHPERPLAAELPRDLGGKTICLHGEQGIGDELFFLRFAPLLKKRGCRIVCHANPKLVPVLVRCTALDEVLPNVEPFTRADHVLLMGDLLAHLLGSAEACTSPYAPELPPPLPLAPAPGRVAQVRQRLQNLGPPPYVGITWRAGTGPAEQRGHIWYLYKEAPLAEIGALMRSRRATLLSLQRRPVAGETEALAAHAGRPVHDLSGANEDLEEMLALLSVIDEYVGVSNTNMHLRAGVGKTARVLVPWSPEWRWLFVGEESPWFPGFRIYRQRPDGDWREALAHLAADLVAVG